MRIIYLLIRVLDSRHTSSRLSTIFTTCLALIISTACAQKTKKTYIPSEPKKCTYTRAAIEIGSEETRLKVAKVNVCKGIIAASELELREKVDYRGDYRKSSSQSFSTQIMEQGLKVLKGMKAKAQELEPEAYITIATGVFRDAKNAKPFVEKINAEFGIEAQIASPTQEAVLGFYSVFHTSRLEKEKLITWHISSESQQIVFYQGFNKFEVYEGKLGSQNFKSYVLKRILGKKAFTPNPINKFHSRLALNYIENTARKTTKASLQNKIKEEGLKVVAIGDVHLNSVLKLVYPNNENIILTPSILEAKLDEVLNKKDSDFSNHMYPELAVTNLILVLGYMKELNIQSMEVFDMNLTEGVVLNQSYWGPNI